jgi:hypothetical protein
MENRDSPKHSNDKVVRGRPSIRLSTWNIPAPTDPRGKKAAETSSDCKTVPGKGTHPGSVPFVTLLPGRYIHVLDAVFWARIYAAEYIKASGWSDINSS